MDKVIQSFMTSLNDIMFDKGVSMVCLGEALGIDPSVVRRWCNKGKDVRLKTLIKLADYFQCSIEFLCGKSQEYVDFESQTIYQSFGERLVDIMKQTNTIPAQLFVRTKIIPSKYYYWLGGGEPGLTSLETLAQYFNVTLDYLIGRASY